MKKLLLIILLFGVSQAQVNKKKLRSNIKDCENALSACLSAQNITSDTIYIYTAKEAVKVAKQVEKTKRKVKVQETKQNKSNNKTDVKTDWFLNLMQGMTRMTAILTAGGFVGGGVVITKLLQAAKSKISWLNWLPI
jgi:hypothetical protein